MNLIRLRDEILRLKRFLEETDFDAEKTANPIQITVPYNRDPATLGRHDTPKQVNLRNPEWTCRPRDGNATTPRRFLLLVEGYLIFAVPDIAELFSIRLWLDSDYATCLERRWLRDGQRWAEKSKTRQGSDTSVIVDRDSFKRWFDALVWARFQFYESLQIEHAREVRCIFLCEKAGPPLFFRIDSSSSQSKDDVKRSCMAAIKAALEQLPAAPATAQTDLDATVDRVFPHAENGGVPLVAVCFVAALSGALGFWLGRRTAK